MSMVRDRAESTEINPYEPQYTWTFNEKSLLIRSYLWVYEPSNPKSTSFCRLFWSMVCMPLMLPLRLFLIAVHLIAVAGAAVGRGIAWPVKQIPFEKYGDAWSARQRRIKMQRADEECAFLLTKARKEAEERAERARLVRERLEQEDLGWQIWLEVYGGAYPPKPEAKKVAMSPAPMTKFDKPKKVKEGPSVPERFTTVVAERADKISAYFQAHPEIGQKMDAFFTKLGRFIVRFVFYPLMVLIPLSVASFAGYELFEHRKGLGSGTESVAVPTGHYTAVAAGASWEVLLGLFISFTVAILFCMGLGWLILKLDKYAEGSMSMSSKDAPRKEVVLHKQSAIGAQVDKGTAIAWTGVKGLGRGIAVGAEFFGRFIAEVFGSIGGPVGKVFGWIGTVCVAVAGGIVFFAKGIWWCVCTAFKGVALVFSAIGAVLLGIAALVVAAARSIGGATTTTGKFFIMGHHTLKSRTCPKIIITSGDEE